MAPFDLPACSHDRQGLWQRADRAPAHEFEIDAQAEWLREVAKFGEMRRQPRMVAIVTGYGDRHGAEIGGGLEHASEGLHVDIRRELDEFDIAHADTLRRQDLLERAVGFRSDPRRIGRTARRSPAQPAGQPTRNRRAPPQLTSAGGESSRAVRWARPSTKRVISSAP